MRDRCLHSLALALLCVCSLSAQELLNNPGFEVVTENGLPTGWTRYGGLVPESRLEVSTDAHSGLRAARFLDTGPKERNNKWATGVLQNVPAKPGKHYLLSVWSKCLARNHDDAVSLQLRFLPSNKLHAVSVNPKIGGGWRKFSVAGQSPADTTGICVYLYTQHYWTCDSLVDDASLQEVDPQQWGARFPLLALGGMGIDEPRKLHLQTPIVVDGKPAATILIPEGDEYAVLGKRLTEILFEKTGARLPITTEGKPLVASAETVLALGNLNNNWVIERLYWNKYLQVDSLSPGPGRYVLQSVHEPYNGPKGKNVLVVGASDLAGLKAGVDDLAERVPKGESFVLDKPLLYVSGAAAMSDDARTTLLSQRPGNDALRDFWLNARRYRDTGDLAYAENAKRLLLFCGKRFEADPHYHVTWPEETSSNWLGAMWDVLEEAPVFTADERLQCTNALLATLYNLPPRCSGYGAIEENDSIIWNHTTFPLLGMYWLARYFDRYYGDVDSRIAPIVRKVHHAFAGQLTSWKPQEDSCGYVSIVPRHTIDYSLAEGDYTYFENGSVLRHAEYEVGFCDNTGDAAGFGDSGYGHGPYSGNLHWALWYYKDGRLLWWLNRVLEGGYKNPYDPTVQPKPWNELVGVNVFKLHPQVYEYTRTHSDYGGEVTPPNIPREKAFDKLSFRENLDKDSEYFLLDGYARGKHLHYDGNAISKFYADGQDWLIDGDYLVRNTTDHNAVSIIRDGRCDQLIPPCVALERVADLPEAALVETAVYDYNGADWTRDLFWLKGEFVVVTDRMKAREPGRYTFLGNWKTLAEGEQTLTEGRLFKTSRKGYGEVGSRDLITMTSPAEGVEKAVKFATAYAQLDMGLKLAGGRYAMTLFASGTGSGSDSFYVSIDDSDRIAFHIPVNRFGPSSSTWTKDTSTPDIEVAKDGLHRVTISLREGPGPLLDRILLRDANGKTVADIQAEEAPPLPADWIKPAPASEFYVKNDGFAHNKLAWRINHVGRHITYLRERFGGDLTAGEARTLHNVFYNDTDKNPKDYDLRRLSDEAVLVLKGGEPFMVCAAGEEAKLGRGVDGKMMMLTKEGVWTAGREEADAGAARRTFDSFVGRAQQPRRFASEGSGAQRQLSVAWQLRLPVGQGRQNDPILKLYPVDLDGDGTDEIVALRGKSVHCLDAEGKIRWSFDTGAICRAVCAADLDGDGKLEVLIGSDDEMIYVLDATGKKLREHHANIPLRVGMSSVRQPRVGNLAVADLDGDGAVEIVAGLLNANVVCYSPDFEERWRINSIPHGTGDLRLLDLDGDGKLEAACANKYGAVQVLSAAGAQVSSVYSELGDVVMAFGDMDGDGKVEVANGSSAGAFTCQTFRGEVRFRFPNYGFAVRDVAMADVRGDKRPELLVASETGYVYLLGPDGDVLAQRNFGDAVTDLAILRTGSNVRIVVACADGGAYLVDGNAVTAALYRGDQPVNIVEVMGASGQSRLLAATADTLVCCVP